MIRVLIEDLTRFAQRSIFSDVASAWTLVVLPLASALTVKAHDVIAGLLRSRD